MYMSIAIKYLIVILAGYFLGNFATGQWVGYRFGKTDIRNHGSGNQGTTNVLRTLGYLPSALTLLGDALKGALAALIGFWLLGPVGARLGGLMAIVGRLFPALYHFKGGKGIATALGVLIVTEIDHPWVLLVLLAVQAAIIALTKYMSLASIVTAALYFVMTWILHRGEPAVVILAFILAALLISAHRKNITRLLAGVENKLDFSKFHVRNEIDKGEKS
jgi:glycerol-3-phosphate acyltransferase PlsY